MSRCNTGTLRGNRGLAGQLCARLCLAFSLCIMTTAVADERILSYDITVDIARDASIEITESITVRAEGKQIRRGIFRTFPTNYRDGQGNRVRVDFEPLSVERDGQPEPWFTERAGNGVILYIGSANRYLDPGVYRYDITYRTNRQLGFFDDFDSFYYTVIGHDWVFPIDQASARVRLPDMPDEAELRLASYAGPFGSHGRAAETFVEANRGVVFELPGGLASGEGLTVSIDFPKGVVDAPTDAQKARWFFRDNGGALVLLLAFLGLLGWYLWAWNRKGRDPAKGVIIPRYQPPEGLSPAACRYVRDMGFRRQAFTAAVVSLGVKGHVLIEEEDGDFTLRATDDTVASRQALSPGEAAVMDALLPGGRGSIALEQKNHSRFGKALSGINKALKAEYKGRLFNLNGLYALPAIIGSVLATILAALLGQANPLIWVAWALAAIGLHVLFIVLLRAPTVIGRQVMDEIEGFQLYLETAEQDRLDRMQSPALTPEVFEAFLPYAFALGVENAWSERFEREFPQQDTERGGYHPAWYHGKLGRATAIHHIGSNLGSDLSSAISSASTAPCSSSGGGGGGFSGGGGGGGGGGGW
ncbi:MAG: DUF2207 domain-containing protein [Pseudomonadota bacterium]